MHNVDDNEGMDCEVDRISRNGKTDMLDQR